jgi:glutathione S-transferase
MKLHYFPMSTYSQKVLLALYEKGAPFDRELVILPDPEGRAKYEKIYPIGKVPLLVLDDGHMIPESTIIIEYLEGHFQQGTQLIPPGGDNARKVRFNDRMVDLYVNDPLTVLLLDQFNVREFLPADLDKARKTLGISCQFLDRSLAATKWLASDDFTMADCALIPCLFYLGGVFPFDGYTNVVRYWQQAQQRSSYRAVQEEFLPIWNEMLAAKPA